MDRAKFWQLTDDGDYRTILYNAGFEFTGMKIIHIPGYVRFDYQYPDKYVGICENVNGRIDSFLDFSYILDVF